MNTISPGQAGWRDRFEDRHRFGIPLDPTTVRVADTGGTTMARTIKLPARSNAQTFEPSEVADVRLSLLNPELPSGEGVVIADATDTAPKARVRNRNMVKALKDAQTVTADLIPGEFWIEDEDGDEDENLVLPEWIEAYRDESEDEDAEATYTLPAVEARAHTVEDGGTFYPVLSVKP